MSVEVFVSLERSLLVDLLQTTGPSAATLLPDWSTAMLAAHLVLRERRPDAALGLVVPLVAAHTDRVQRRLADRPWDDLVQLVATGPPRAHPARWSPRFAEAADLVEFYVHGEDIRRAQPGWERRSMPSAQEDALWKRLEAMSRLLYRSHPMSVVLRRDSGEEVWAGGSAPGVTVTGAPSELLLHAFGRDRQDASVAQVSVSAGEQAREAYARLGRGL